MKKFFLLIILFLFSCGDNGPQNIMVTNVIDTVTVTDTLRLYESYTDTIYRYNDPDLLGTWTGEGTKPGWSSVYIFEAPDILTYLGIAPDTVYESKGKFITYTDQWGDDWIQEIYPFPSNSQGWKYVYEIKGDTLIDVKSGYKMTR